MGRSSQFMRSKSASIGEALACTPLSLMLGSHCRPKSCQLLKIEPRMESSGAAEGSQFEMRWGRLSRPSARI